MINTEEIASLTEMKVANITYPQIKAAIDSLESDHEFRNQLVAETREMKPEGVGFAYMVIIFRYIQAEVISENNGVTRITSGKNSIANLREVTEEGEGK